MPQPAPDDLADLNAGQQGALWAADRVNLANCGAQHWVLIQWAKAVQVSFDGMRANDLRFTTRSVTY